ncbi:aminotransferase class IV [Burkholderia glumae]|uniref:aminotransferase class IV n=1 Tax=Burkholderia glumae TaxID=337 RepID=UPI001374504A|nr:aminotransferase class IV [Burkholderia glumae]QHP93968.1 aminotransferase class IV [Burkholderia glumae]
MAKIIFHAGDYVDASQATVRVSSLAMRYGLSVFEGVRAYLSREGRLRPFRMAAHLERLASSARTLGLPDPGIERIPEVVERLIEANGLREDCYIRPSIHAVNVGDMGAKLEAALTVDVKPMGRKKWLGEDLAAKVTISSWRKARHDVFPPALKCISAYSIPFVADHAARAAGFDFPVFLNDEGYLSEAPTAALFLVTGRRLRTPALDQAILPSITREAILQIGAQEGLTISEERLMPHELHLADEAFLCGTGLEIAPIASVDSSVLRNHAPRPVTRRLVDRYFDLVREDHHE